VTRRPLREARIDLAAISRNVEVLRRTAGTEHAMAVVKADGFGHGAVPVARAALRGGADWLGVVDVPEAMELRAAGIREPVLAWLHGPDEGFGEAIAAGIDLGVSHRAELERVVAAGHARVQLMVDTGLSRNGAVPDEWEDLFAAAAEHERRGRLRVRGVFSHLANAGEAADAVQLAQFERAVALARCAGLEPELTHLAASAAALRRPAARLDMVRLGLGVYGLSPLTGCTSASLGLTPAMELSSAVVSVKRVAAGVGVSYGYDFRTTCPTTLALVPLGYADGVPRHASAGGPVSIGGSTYRVAGRVAMDQIVVEVGDGRVAPGDRAVVFGDPGTGAPSADDWAGVAGTINYEIVTRVGPRVERTYLDAS
jgi:alanine racemase